jgi:translation initiation factor 2 alpha subunit (eIF-2alpha)
LGDDNKTLEAFAPQLKIFEAVLKQQREALATLGAKQKALERLKEKFHDAIEPGP